MNINRMLMLATVRLPTLTANAQVKLNDKNANAYDLGYGVEISNFLQHRFRYHNHRRRIAADFGN